MVRLVDFGIDRQPDAHDRPSGTPRPHSDRRRHPRPGQRGGRRRAGRTAHRRAARTVLPRPQDAHGGPTRPRRAYPIVAEAGRALNERDVTDVTGVDVLATVAATPTIARTIDAGLLACRYRNLPEFRALRRWLTLQLDPFPTRRPDPRRAAPNHPSMSGTDLPLPPDVERVWTRRALEPVDRQLPIHVIVRSIQLPPTQLSSIRPFPYSTLKASRRCFSRAWPSIEPYSSSKQSMGRNGSRPRIVGGRCSAKCTRARSASTSSIRPTSGSRSSSESRVPRRRACWLRNLLDRSGAASRCRSYPPCRRMPNGPCGRR